MAQVEAGAAELLSLGCAAVLIKGGHADGSDAGVVQDYFTDGDTQRRTRCTPTPCTFPSAHC